ncbi:MAG TPA: hypothetical protein VMR98_04745 [Candidatus Polarisedimenticolaceae bacterium]|nr:hypothetical protein [Candidatus Polarisedimenticolaceae bacterium]
MNFIIEHLWQIILTLLATIATLTLVIKSTKQSNRIKTKGDHSPAIIQSGDNNKVNKLD